MSNDKTSDIWKKCRDLELKRQDLIGKRILRLDEVFKLGTEIHEINKQIDDLNQELSEREKGREVKNEKR